MVTYQYKITHVRQIAMGTACLVFKIKYSRGGLVFVSRGLYLCT